MRPFHTIAVAHPDILESKLTLDVFAADLWEVLRGTAPDEYRDPTQFFQKTHETDGLKHLLSVVERRLNGQGGDPVIQLQTPFGGGKTHALIAMYHKANQWKVQRTVIVGTPMRANDTLWGVLERQLTGKIERFDGLTSPGRDAIYELLSEKQPGLILMDEVLEYVTKAAGVKVEDSTLASQTFAFMQELTEAVSILEKVVLVITLPSSTMEHYDEQAEQLFSQFQHVTGRVEKIYTPVQEHEITEVIRRRLFSSIDNDAAGEVIQDFMDYAVSESMLPPGTERSEYRKRFETAYPFLPEVIDVLYQRWGSFPNFQRTRGVLRLLSLVLYSLREKTIPYVTLADFDLSVQEIRRELLKHIGQQYDSIIAADITSDGAGAKQVDVGLGDAYKGFRLGSRSATTIFLYSFSGKPDPEKQGANLGEIKRSATTTGNPSSVVTEASEQLRNKLFYLQHDGERTYFANQPNLNRILQTRMENVTDTEIDEFEETALKSNLSGKRLKTFVWEKDGSGIQDNAELKLVIFKARDETLMKNTLEMKGNTPRANRNTLFFLTPLERERIGFYNQLRRVIAYRTIASDKTLTLSPEQEKEVRTQRKKAEDGISDILQRYYRNLFIPTRGGLKESDLGISTYGDTKKLDEVVYDKLKSDSEILENIHPLAIKERYLKTNETVSTEQLYQSAAKTPGEARVISQEAWESGIREGVKHGLFGLGELEDGKPTYRYFKESPLLIAFTGSEVLIREDICIAQKAAKAEKGTEQEKKGISTPDLVEGQEGIGKPADDSSSSEPSARKEIYLQFTVPKGQVAGLMGVMNLLQLNFDNLQIELRATGGEMSEQDYEDKIKEAFAQLEIDLTERE